MCNIATNEFNGFKNDNFLVIAVHNKVFKLVLSVVVAEERLLFYFFVAKVDRDLEELVVCQSVYSFL